MLSRFRNRYFFFLDLILLALTPLLALALRVNLPWDANYNTGLIYYVIFSIPVKIIVFRIFGLYKRLWRYASVDAIFSIHLECWHCRCDHYCNLFICSWDLDSLMCLFPDPSRLLMAC